MNLNPFVYKYKKYQDAPLATALNNFLGAMQRLFLFFGVGIILVIIFEEVPNWGEALCGASVCLVLYLIIRLFKTTWSDNLADKEQKKNKI